MSAQGLRALGDFQFSDHAVQPACSHVKAVYGAVLDGLSAHQCGQLCRLDCYESLHPSLRSWPGFRKVDLSTQKLAAFGLHPLRAEHAITGE